MDSKALWVCSAQSLHSISNNPVWLPIRKCPFLPFHIIKIVGKRQLILQHLGTACATKCLNSCGGAMLIYKTASIPKIVDATRGSTGGGPCGVWCYFPLRNSGFYQEKTAMVTCWFKKLKENWQAFESVHEVSSLLSILRTQTYTPLL